MDKDKLQKLRESVASSSRIVFFGGAGVSTESGIPDFRSEDGLYSKKYSVPAEVMLSRTYYDRHTEEFFNFYRDKMLFLDAKPNKAHIKLAELEREGKLSAVITQNIDGLHTLAGSRRVFELHGSVHRNYCTRCSKFYGAEYILNSKGVPKCSCGGVIKPDVLLYEEPVDRKCFSDAARAVADADMLIVAGTSLSVYPAAGLIEAFEGERFVLINKASTPADEKASLVIHDSVGETLGAV